jgi:hypothetical protein
VCDAQDQKFTQPHETTNVENTSYRSQWDREDACLSTAEEEQNHGFKAYLTQKAVEEYSGVEDNMGMKGSEIAPLDALYPMMWAFSAYEKQKTNHRMSAMHESTYKEDVKKIAPLDALYPTMRGLSDNKNQQTNKKMSDMHKSTYQGDVMNETYRENRMSAMHESTYQEDVKDKAYMENGDMPGAVTTTSSSNYGPEDPHNNCMEGMTGTEDNTNTLAMITIASEGGHN